MDRNHTLMSLKYILALLLTGLITAAVLYGALHIHLPEDYAQYEVVLTVFSVISLGFFALCGIPCGIMAAWHSIYAIIKDRKYLFPLLLMLLDAALLSVWLNFIKIL